MEPPKLVDHGHCGSLPSARVEDEIRASLRDIVATAIDALERHDLDFGSPARQPRVE